jgi:hypothetical protein
VVELLAERGLDISRNRRIWVLKFGPVIARRLRRRRPRPSNRWRLDEAVIRIAGERMYLWRAVDHEGEVLDMLVQAPASRRSTAHRSSISWTRHSVVFRSGPKRVPLSVTSSFAMVVLPTISETHLAVLDSLGA